MKYGLKSISMDNIATDIGISKKTIYQHFENKEDLIQRVLAAHISEEKEYIQQILTTSGDAIEEMINIARHAIQMMKGVRPTVMFDLKKYYRESWHMLETQFFSFIQQTIFKNINEGISQGYYRNDINPLIISKLYLSKSMTLLDDALFPDKEFDREELYREMIMYHLRGIASIKGLERIAQFKPETT